MKPFAHLPVVAAATACALLALPGCRSTRVARGPDDDSAADVWKIAGSAVVEPRAGPAEICPADIWLYAEFTGLADFHTAAFTEHVSWYVDAAFPPVLQQRVARAFGQTKRELFDRIFGDTMAVITVAPERGSPLFVMSRLDAADLRRLPAAAGARPWSAAPHIGRYAIYRVGAAEHGLLAAVGQRWLLLAEARHATALRRFLTDDLAADGRRRRPLAAQLTYRTLEGRLPDHRFAFVLARAGDHDWHAAALTRTARGISVRHRAIVPVKVAAPSNASLPAGAIPALPFLSVNPTMDFGPLPRQETLVAASLNVLHRQPHDLGALDIPIISRSVREAILPGIAAPLVAFVGEVRLPDTLGSLVPVGGVAVRLDNPATGVAIARLIRTFHWLTTLSAFELRQSFFGVKRRRFEGVDYRVNDFGSAITARLPDGPYLPLVELPDPAGLRRVTHGRIGRWYVICSQEEYFRKCVRAAADPRRRWPDAALRQRFGLNERRQLVATAAADVPRVARMLERAAARYEKRSRAGRKPGDTRPTAERRRAPRAGDRPTPPFRRIDEALHTAADVAGVISDLWRRTFTPATRGPAAHDRSELGRKRRPGVPESVAETRQALRPLRWLSDILSRQHSFALQVRRDATGSPASDLLLLVPPDSRASAQ